VAEVIEDHFPCLETLYLDLKYDTASEAESLRLLKPSMAYRRGRLRTLDVRVLDGTNPARSYNLLRQLNPLLAREGSMRVSNQSGEANNDALYRYMWR
jgi:hypothetical protein